MVTHVVAGGLMRMPKQRMHCLAKHVMHTTLPVETLGQYDCLPKEIAVYNLNRLVDALGASL